MMISTGLQLSFCIILDIQTEKLSYLGKNKTNQPTKPPKNPINKQKKPKKTKPEKKNPKPKQQTNP